jgi:hypothetical protein
MKVHKRIRNRTCPICREKLHPTEDSGLFCNKCETEWFFDSKSNIIKYVYFHRNKNN